jgi:TonB-linked SusC/RagA family outer membrane protein
MKKRECSAGSGTTYSIIKYLLMMKMTILLICSLSLQSFATDGFGQDNITLRLDNATLRKAFREIEKQTSFRFVYNEEVVPNDQKVSIHVQEQPLSAVMRKLLEKTSLTFRVMSSDLVVISTEVDKEDADQSSPPAVTIKGKVVNSSNQSVVNASVVEKGTNNGTVTNEDGNFTLTVLNEQAVLVISSVGFKTLEVSISGRTNVTVQLQEENVQMNEVIVVGYGTQRRGDVTGSIASVPKGRLSQIPVTNLLHALEGSVAGLNITQTSSVPGSSAGILIRGQNTIGASSNPLIIVDGVPFNKAGGLTNDINPNDIASIEVLKDASATAIYGVNGANGVILITTKRGTIGKPVIRYNTYVGFDNIAHMLTPLSPQGYANKYADYKQQVPTAPQTVLWNAFEIANYNAGKKVDWVNEATQQGVMQDHNISISGGTKDTKYYLSGEYMKQKGAVKGYQYHRASLRSNLDVNITDFLSAGTSLSFASNNYDGGRVNFYLAAAMSPYGSLYNQAGNYEIYPMSPELLYTNPLLGLTTDRTDRSHNLTGNGYAEVKFSGLLTGLKYRLNTGYTYITTRFGSYTGRAANNQIGAASESSSETNHWVVENIITYNKTWGAHHIDFTGLYSSERRDYFAQGFIATGFINDELSFYNMGAAATLSAGTGTYRDKYGLISQMGRINYSYNSKYLLTVSARRDGSSVMGANTSKYGVFPSMAIGWNVSNESFLSNGEFINNLKLRSSYGKAGNEAIGVYQTITTDATVRYPFAGISNVGVLASNLGNANLHWETSKTFNIGMDFGVLKNRINGSIDLYSTKTEGLILRRFLPTATGYGSILDNLGITKNRGIEITLNSDNFKTKDFQWQTSIVFASNKNQIVDLYGDKKDDLGNRWFIGHPIGVIYDYKLAGVWQVGEDPSSQDPGAKPGDLKFADVNGDKKITADDKMILGQTRPKWTGGLTNTFHYRNFHLNIFIQTVQGNLKNNITLTYADEAGRMNIPQATGYWTATNKSNTRPSLAYTNTRGYGYPSDNSYTRIKDVTLSYVFSQRILDRIKLSSLTVYASGRNLYTFTDWIGWDPENNYSFRGSGDWTNNYPLTRSIVFGVNVSLR